MTAEESPEKASESSGGGSRSGRRRIARTWRRARKKAWVRILAVVALIGGVATFIGHFEKVEKVVDFLWETYYSKTDLKFRDAILRTVSKASVTPLVEYSLDDKSDTGKPVAKGAGYYEYEFALTLVMDKRSVPPVQACRCKAAPDEGVAMADSNETISLSRGRYDQIVQYTFRIQTKTETTKWRFQVICKDVVSPWLVFDMKP